MGTVDVIKVILAELERIRTAEVTEEELQTARDSLLNATVFAYDTRAKLMGRTRPNEADVLGGKEQAESGTFEATVPAGKEYAVLLGRAKQKTEVKLKVTGK